jgi:hypothetical protein
VYSRAGDKSLDLHLSQAFGETLNLSSSKPFMGVRTAVGIEEDEYGHFAWIMDPEGNRIELWEPLKTLIFVFSFLSLPQRHFGTLAADVCTSLDFTGRYSVQPAI